MLKIYAVKCTLSKAILYYKFYNDFFKLKIRNSFLKYTQIKEKDDID